MIRNRSIRAVSIKTPKQKKHKQKRKFGLSGFKYEDIPQYLRRAWIKVFSPEDLPKNPRGLVKCVYKFKESCYSPWLYNKLYGFERTNKEWCQLYKEYKKAAISAQKAAKTPVEAVVPTSYLDDIKNPNPFLKSKHIAVHILRLYDLNTRIHSIILKFVQRRRLATMSRRLVGEEDLYTTSQIPKHSLVAVYDFQTQSVYHFHTQTILRMILASLYYSSYGIARPGAPKNPYTNLEWTFPQLISIVQQITINMMGIHRVPPNILLAYHACSYNLKKFTEICANQLGIHAGIELFKNKDDSETKEIYRETLEDFADEAGVTISGAIREIIFNRKLPGQLQKYWDNIIVSIWIYNNLNLYHGEHNSYEELTDGFIALIDDTKAYYIELRRGQLIRQRSTSDVLRVPMNVHTAASIVLAQILPVESQAGTSIPPTLPIAPTQPVHAEEGPSGSGAPIEDTANTL
jgi:hypothetical protein